MTTAADSPPRAAPERPIVVVSNRGPLSFAIGDDGGLTTRRGGGGLITALGPALAGTDAIWMAGAMSDADRVAASQGMIEAEGFRMRLLAIDDAARRAYYDVIANGTLWFLHHGLWDQPRRPRFDRAWWAAWEQYRQVNAAFADAVAEAAPPGAIVLIQDYHLALVGTHLARSRPDLATLYFQHTPFCSPEELRVLPDAVARELVAGMAANGVCGFHATRWAQNFERCCQAVGVPVPPTLVAPATIDVDDLREVARSQSCQEAVDALDAIVGDRKLIVRVDRIELSKNIVRGFLAYDDLLRHRPEWREKVLFAASVYPSREGLADYLAYRHEVESVIERINAEWGTDGWTPIVYDPDDHFPRSVAALRRADVLLVNPVRDGLNLVAKEGPAVNDRELVVVLSRESGVFEELSGPALAIHPFDLVDTSDALHRALAMPPAERTERAAALRERSVARTPADWLATLVAAAAPDGAR